MLILDIISQIIEQEEQFKMDSSDDDSVGTIDTDDIELLDENSDEDLNECD